jgi:hypothetical protein
MSRDLVTIAHFTTVIEADMAKSQLDAEGIMAFVVNAGAIGVMPYLGASGGVRLQVAEDDAERAGEVLGLGGSPGAGPYRTSDK